MKRIFLNKAIVSYANFVKRVVNLSNNEKDDVTKEQYKKVLDSYKRYKNDENVMIDVSCVLSCPGISGMELVKIYYADITQIWAFIHILVVNITKNKNIMKLSNMTNEEFETIKKTLHSLWYAPHSDETYEFVYLEDDEVMFELRCLNLKKQLERSSEVIKKSVERMDCLFA